MAIDTFKLAKGQLAERKLLITVAEWTENGGTKPTRQLIGTRTESSAIEFNPDKQKMTDILGITYTDVNKIEPGQSLDPFMIMGGSPLAELLDDIMYRQALTELNQFNVYIIRAYVDKGTGNTHAYKTEMHKGCTITVTSLGGDSRVNMPIEIDYSNDRELGSVEKLADDFVFTPAVIV